MSFIKNLLTSDSHRLLFSLLSAFCPSSSFNLLKSSCIFPYLSEIFSSYLQLLLSYYKKKLYSLLLLFFSPSSSFSGSTSSSEPRELASLGSLLDDQHWHHVVVEQKNVHLNLTVDKHTEAVQIPEEFSLWAVKQACGSTDTHPHKHAVNTNTCINTDTQFKCFSCVCMQMSVGAAHNSAISKTNFQGCLENLLFNSINLIELIKHRNQQVTVQVNTVYCGN